MTIVQTDIYGPAAADIPRVCEIFDAELSSEDPYVQGLVSRVVGRRGKMLRPALVLLSGRALGQCRQEHVALAAVVEMVHIASLVHDDIIDEAHARRQMPSVNRVAGNEGAVLLGDYIIARAFHLCNSLRSHEVNSLLTDTCKMICLGELMQVSHRGDFELGEDRYLDIIAKKTASLMRTCSILGAVCAGADANTAAQFGRYGQNLGMAFQISDDLLDLYGTEEEVGKTLGHDLNRGELTLPLIRFLSAAPPASRQEMLVAIREGVRGGLSRIRRLLLDDGCIEYCRQLAGRYGDQAIACLDGLPAGDAKDALAALPEFVLLRRS